MSSDEESDPQDEDSQSWAEWNANASSGNTLAWPGGFDGWEHAVNTKKLPDPVVAFTAFNTQTEEPHATLDHKFEKNDIIRKDYTGGTETFFNINWLVDRRVQTPVLTLNHLAFPTNEDDAEDPFDRITQDGSVECRFEHIDDLSVADDNYAARIPEDLRKPADADAGTVYIKPGTRYVAATSAKMLSRHATWILPLTAYQDLVCTVYI